MDVQTFINNSNGTFLESNFEKFITSNGGIYKLKIKDLDKIIEALPQCTTSQYSFVTIYKIVADKGNTQLIKVWTWIAGISAVVNMVFVIVN